MVCVCGVVLHIGRGLRWQAWVHGQWEQLFTDFGFFRIITYEEKICFGFFRISLEEACLALGINEKSVDRTNRTMVDSPGPDRTKTRPFPSYIFFFF